MFGTLMAALGLAQAGDAVAKKLGAPGWLRGILTGPVVGGYNWYNEGHEAKAAGEAEAAAELRSKQARASAGLPSVGAQRAQRQQEAGSQYTERYAPENRQPQPGVDPELMSYLQKFMRPR